MSGGEIPDLRAGTVLQDYDATVRPLFSPDKDVLRVVERCLDVLLSDHVENHEVARDIAKYLSFPVLVVGRPADDRR